MDKVELFGIGFNNYDFQDLFAYIENAIAAREPTYVLTCNVDHLVKLRTDYYFKRVYEEAGATVADGMPIVWASRLLGKPLKRRVSGSDIMPEMGYALERKRYQIYLLGAAEGVAIEAKEQLLKRFPALNIVGCYSPPIGFEQDEEESGRIIGYLREAKPDLLFVGVGSPKQEKWIHRYCREYEVPVSIGIGAAFDFLAGRVKRAPVFLRKTGLEWLWRLLREPKRLWRRYLVEDTRFAWMLIREFKNKKRRERHGAYSERN